jgi:hypothetical protein
MQNKKRNKKQNKKQKRKKKIGDQENAPSVKHSYGDHGLG